MDSPISCTTAESTSVLRLLPRFVALMRNVGSELMRTPPTCQPSHPLTTTQTHRFHRHLTPVHPHLTSQVAVVVAVVVQMGAGDAQEANREANQPIP